MAALLCAAVALLRETAHLRSQNWTLRPWRLAVATILELLTLAWGVYLWSRILSCFDGAAPGYRNLLRAWRASTIARYLPGSVWSAASTIEMAGRIGVSPIALPSSFLIQGALSLVGALTIATLSGSTRSPAGVTVSPWLAAAAALGAVMLVHPRVVNALVSRAARAAGRTAPRWEASWPAGALLLLLHVAAWASYGVAFALFLSALAPAAEIRWLDLAGINALAFVAGFVVFFAPGGLGIRETALVGLLAAILPGWGMRVAVAAASRVWLVLTEIAGGALVTVVGRRDPAWAGHARAHQPHTVPEVREGDEPRVPLSPAATSSGAVRDTAVDLLTDTRAALADILAACDAATRSIWISQLAFDADCAAHPDRAPHGRTLLETLVAAAQRVAPNGAPLDVRIVLNGGLLLDTSPALRRAIAALGADGTVQLRTVMAFPQVMHAKVLVVDGEDAFLSSASFVNGYWDDARHAPEGALDAGAGTAERPLHDVAVRLRGSAARELGAWFEELWDRAAPGAPDADTTPVASPSQPSAPAPAADVAVRVLRTQPDAGDAPGRTEILDAYLDAISRARSCIYLESQYFSARPIARAVRMALDAHPALEVVLVLNQNPDITAYRAWQDARLAEHGLLGHPRVGVFALWSATPSLRMAGRIELTQVFVHSKVGVIDDRWATLGTANLDGASLHSYGDDFASWAGRRVFGGYRNYDLNIELLDEPNAGGGRSRMPLTGLVPTLRQRLWSRHLGLPEEDLLERPAGGWLPMWRRRAAAHVAAVKRGEPPTGRALPYVPRAHPRAQLRALGIDLDAAELVLRFDPGWIETHCSPGWMLKLLPDRVRAWL